MNGHFTVEATNRWDAVALLRLLTSYHPWTIQLGEERWLVVARADTEQAGDDAKQLVDRWAMDRGQHGVAPTVGLEPLRGGAHVEEHP